MILYLIVIWNLIVFLIYGYDKRQSRLNKWRVSEKFLLLSAMLCAGAGALAGMEVFRHKTKHIKFMVIVPIGCVITLTVVIYIIYTGIGI